MIWLVIVFLFSFGLVVGSFLNVLIYRMTMGEDWVRGRSRCDHCHKQIAWYDNIPLLSYLLLRGQCRHCHQKIAVQHLALELMTGFLFVWWYAIGFAFFKLTTVPQQVIQPAFWLIVGILLLIIFMADWLYQIIPDFANIGLGLLALGYRVYLTSTGVMRFEDLMGSVAVGLGLMGFLGFLWWITKGKGMGFGDVKFALVMGLLLGWPRGMIAMFLAFILGAMVGVILLLVKIKKLKERIAFGPFLVLGTAIALVWGNQLFAWYLQVIGG